VLEVEKTFGSYGYEYDASLRLERQAADADWVKEQKELIRRINRERKEHDRRHNSEVSQD